MEDFDEGEEYSDKEKQLERDKTVNEFIGSLPSLAMRQLAWVEDGDEHSIIFSGGKKNDKKTKNKNNKNKK